MPDYSQRSAETEIMDDLTSAGEVIHRTLYELDVINKWLGGNQVTTGGVRRLLKKKKPAGPVTIADLGCGGGDMLRQLSRFKKRQPLVLTGIDANPHIVAYARAHTADLADVHFLALDIFSEAFSRQRFDIVVATLFFHHFTSAQLAGFFRQLKKQVRLGVVVNDIHRHWFAYHSIRLLTKYFSRSPMVIHDAPLSVLRAFRKKELRHIMQQAGITHYTLRWRWAFRWQLVIEFQEG